jgi:hypothetical protein
MGRHNETDLKLQSITPLTENQEILLSQYSDGECGMWRAILAKRLISKNPAAKDFLLILQSVKDTCTLEFNSAPPPSIDLWDRISTRITQEERSALYLGERRLEHKAEPAWGEPNWSSALWNRMRSPYAVVGGVTGAACAAILLTVMYRPSNVVSFSAPQTAMQNTMPYVQPVAVSGKSYRPRVAAPLQQPSLEVDWMRSHGSVKVIPDPNGSSAIIWVRRRQALPSLPRIQSAIQATPPTLRAANPTATIALIEERLDEIAKASAK